MAESKATEKVVEEKVTAKAVKEQPKAETTASKAKTISDADVFTVKSIVPNVHYTCSKTQDYYIWADVGDENEMTFAQLKVMKNKHIGYFSKGWLIITDNGASRKLDLDKYYNDGFGKRDYKLFYGNDVDKVEKKLAFLPDSEKEQLSKRIIKSVSNGDIQNVKIIRLLEKTFDIELMDLV